MTDTSRLTEPAALAGRFKTLVAEKRIAEALDVQRRLWRADPGFIPAKPLGIPLLPWEAGDWQPASAERAAAINGYLFVSGSARSGTTALGRLLGLHPRITMYLELFEPEYGYLPAMFEKENILALNAAGLLPALDRRANSDIFTDAGGPGLVGDKRPAFLRSHQLTLAHFTGKPVTIVHSARRIHEVAHSYVSRAERGTWAASRDHRVAVDELNLNNREALALLDRLEPPHRLILVNYSTFWQDAGNGRALFTLLGLKPWRANAEKVTELFQSATVLAEKERPISDEVRTYIEANYDFAAEEELARRCVL